MSGKVYRYNSPHGGFSSPKGEGHLQRSQALCVQPCTVSQLKSASEHKDSFFIQGLEIHQEDSLDDGVIPPGTYIRVVGILRSFERHRSMVAFSIRRIGDFNEITSHMLEVVQAHLLSNRSSSFRLKNKATTSTIMNSSPACDVSRFGFTASQSQVFSVIKGCPTTEGISVENLTTTLKSLSPYDIRGCLQFLLNEGHIFSTIDENHFKSTSSLDPLA
ncbi:replication protein A 32 kDa subunit-like isoform X2 [Brachyhypopomus gauderio]|uniref:replication protein A 32 kDa subunit-like isoform X2 n=1 Tax=Brachyhypopomus gauderio TaxID=698409 RepID=UPI0040435564